MKDLLVDACPMFGDKCRHVSIEKTHRPYTELTKDPATRLYKPLRSGRSVVVIGAYCNDFGKYVEDMHYCPVKWSLANPSKPEKQKPKKKKTKVFKKSTPKKKMRQAPRNR